MAIVVVHGGAGTHSKASEAELKGALRLACTQALSATQSDSASESTYESGSSSDVALNVVETAIASLEDCPLLNAGTGSNLTLAGTVECDAAIMDGATAHFGSVGAVSGVKNPIRLARVILAHGRISDALGRIPPLTLVGEGARAFASDSHLSPLYPHSHSARVELVAPESLATPRATAQWETWKARLDASSSQPSASLASLDEQEHAGLEEDEAVMQDTVGALAWDGNSNTLAAGVSSGGILLKHPGRVGEAAVFGAGCWAQRGVACSVSGAGEYIIRANLARTLCAALINARPEGSDADVDVHEIMQRVLVEEFWKPTRTPANPDPSAGVILLTTEEGDDGPTARAWCAFTTPSMAIAYASSAHPSGKALILRRPKALDARTGDGPRVFVTGFSV